eukprot:6211279-Pleurochrysis_carterae.AAC.3
MFKDMRWFPLGVTPEPFCGGNDVAGAVLRRGHWPRRDSLPWASLRQPQMPRLDGLDMLVVIFVEVLVEVAEKRIPSQQFAENTCNGRRSSSP